MSLVHGDVLRGSVHFARRGVDDSLDLLFERRLEHVERADDVRLRVVVRRAVRIGNRDERAEMEDALAPRDGPPDGKRVTEISREHLYALHATLVDVVDPSPKVSRVVHD